MEHSLKKCIFQLVHLPLVLGNSVCYCRNKVREVHKRDFPYLLLLVDGKGEGTFLGKELETSSDVLGQLALLHLAGNGDIERLEPPIIW